MKYKLIVADDAEELTEKVNNALAKGWIPHGSPLWNEDDEEYAQAVTK